MEFLGVGPFELIFIAVIALIFLGPKDMVSAGRTLGRTLRKIVMSPMWKAVRATGQGIQDLPNRLIREAGIEEDLKDLEKLEQEVRETTHTLDPRRAASRSIDNPFALTPPEPAPPTYETDLNSGADPTAETSPKDPQV